jgi:hypothetical protein
MHTAYLTLIGPGGTAEQWGDKWGKKAKMGVLRAWRGTGRRKGRERVVVDEDTVLEQNKDEHGPAAAPARATLSWGLAPRTAKRYARCDDSGASSDGRRVRRPRGKLFWVGELGDASRTWVCIAFAVISVPGPSGGRG